MSIRLWLLLPVIAAVLGGYLYLARSLEFPTTETIQNGEYHTRIRLPSAIATGRGIPVTVVAFSGDEKRSLKNEYRMLHVVIASVDGRDVFHTNAPKEIRDGIYQVPHVFTRPGKYRVWTEIGDFRAEPHHGNNADLIAFHEFAASGVPVWNVNESAEGQRSSSGAYTMTVEPKQLQAGIRTKLRIALTDPDAKPLRLYPSEGVFLSLTGPQSDFFEHGHYPTTSDGTAVEIPVLFPAPGTYGLWVNAFPYVGEQLDDVVFRFQLEVK